VRTETPSAIQYNRDVSRPTNRLLELPENVDASPPNEDFVREAEELGIAFDPGDVDRLARFVGLLLRANSMINLTAIREPGPAWRRHILDALTLVPLLADLDDRAQRLSESDAEAAPSVADVGSGGGLPVVPLAIVLPRLRFVAIEATGKKAAFIELAARRLGLDNLTVINDRAEAVARDPLFREAFDAVTARAVGKLAVVAELTVPLARLDGRVLLVKGERADEELAEAKQALHLLHTQHHSTHPSPTGRIVVLTKSKPIPKAYPRKSGEPKHAPLGS